MQQGTFDLLMAYIVDGCSIVDVNANDDQQWTPLHMAAFTGNVAMALRLLEGGANSHNRTAAGETAADIAGRLANTEICKLLTFAQSGVHVTLLGNPDRMQVRFIVIMML